MLVQDKAPAATAPDTGALIEEARRRTRRRRRRGAAAAAILAVGATLGAIAAGGGPGTPSRARAGGGGPGAVSASPATHGTAASALRQLPTSADSWTLQPYGDDLLVSGWPGGGNECTWLLVDPATLRTRRALHANCNRPPIAAAPVVAIQTAAPGNDARVRIARPSPRRVTYGPVLMTFVSVSDTHLEVAYGPGTLWLYAVSAPRHAELLEVSTATGALVDRVAMPRLYEPVIAADADGLWLAASPETDVRGAAPLYRVAPGAHAPTLVAREGHAAVWLLAAGHTVWADIVTIVGRRRVKLAQRIWRFDGPSGTPHRLAADNELQGTTPVVGAGDATLWTLNSSPFAGSYNTCITHDVVAIDAQTGRQAVVAALDDVPGDPCFPDDGAQAFLDGAFYFVNNTISDTLFRVPVTSGAATAAGP